MRKKDLYDKSETTGAEGAILEWNAPRRRPILKFVSSVTCFTFILTQLPIHAYALPRMQPVDSTNLVNGVNSVSNLAFQEERAQMLRRRMEDLGKVQRAVEVGWLTTSGSFSQSLQILGADINRGAEFLQRTWDQGVNRVQELAGVVAGPNNTGTIEFNYMPIKQEGGKPMMLYFRNGLTSRVIGEKTKDGYQDTFNMKYHSNRLLSSYESMEYKEMPGLLGGRLILRTTKWTGDWLPGSMFYASSETQAVRQINQERIETTGFNTWTEADVDRLQTKLTDMESKITSAAELAWVVAMRQALSTGAIGAGVTSEVTSITERNYKKHDRSRPLEWSQKLTDPTGVVESNVVVTYKGPKENNLTSYIEEGTRKSLFISEADFELYQEWMGEILGNPDAGREERSAAERLAGMVARGEIGPGTTVQTGFRVERTYLDYSPKNDPLHYKEKRTSSDSSVVTESEVKIEYDTDRQVKRQEESRTEVGHYTVRDVDAFWEALREIEERSPEQVTSAEGQFAADLRFKLETGEIGEGRIFSREIQVVREGFLYGDSMQAVEWDQTTVIGGTTLKEKVLTYQNDAQGRSLELLTLSDEQTAYTDKDRENLRRRAQEVFSDPDTTDAARDAARETLAALDSGVAMPSVFRRSSVRYEGDIRYNAAGLRIQYTRQSTSNSDKLLTVEEVGGTVYDTRGRELSSLRKVQRIGTDSRNAYLLEDGKEITPEILRTLLEAFSSGGDPVTIQNLMDRGLLTATDASGTEMREEEIEAMLRAHPVSIEGAPGSRPSTLQEVMDLTDDADRPLLRVMGADGLEMTERDVSALLSRESRPAHVATIDELVEKGVLRLESMPMTMNQHSAVDRYGAQYDDMGRLIGVTEETTDPATNLRNLTRIYGTTYDSESRQDSSVTASRQYGESVRMMLFRAGSDQELDALELHDMIQQNGLSLGVLMLRGMIERREATGELDQTTTTYRKATRYYDSNLAEGFSDAVSTKGFGADGITEETQSSLTRYNEAGQMQSQLLMSHRTGMDTATVHKLDGKDLVYEDLRSVMNDTGMSLKDLFDTGRITLEKKASLLDTRTETFRHDVQYDPFTGFLVHQVDFSTGDQNPGTNQITFQDANYTEQGQLSSARTINRSDLFGLEGNATDVWTQYTRTEDGTLRFAEAVGNQATFDIFGSTSAARIEQSFLGIAGQSRMVAGVVSGVAVEVDGSHFDVGQITTYAYDPSAILIGAHGSNFREGSDIFLNYSRRTLENLYSIINGDARVKLSFSTDGSFGPESPVAQPGTGATFTTLPVANDTDITGAAAAPFLVSPSLYISETVRDYGAIKVIAYYNKNSDDSKGALAGVQVTVPGAPIILTDVTSVTPGTETVFQGGSVSKYRYRISADNEGGVTVTRFSLSGTAETETETFFSRTVESGPGTGIFTTTQKSLGLTTAIVHSMGSGSVTVGHLNGNPNGTVTVSIPGSVASFSNVSGWPIINSDSGPDEIRIMAGSDVLATLVRNQSNEISLERVGADTVSVQRLVGPSGETLPILLTTTKTNPAIPADARVTKAVWTHEVSGDILLAVTASWAADGLSAKVMITGMNGVAVNRLLEGVTDLTSLNGVVKISKTAADFQEISVGSDSQVLIRITAAGALASTIETGLDATGARVILYKNAAGTVTTKTIREETGTTLTRVVTYRDAYNPSGTNTREEEMMIGPGFLRVDSYVKADDTVGSQVARRAITYLNMETGRATQAAKIEYYPDSASVKQVEIEQYNPDGATVKVMKVLRAPDGKISGADRQQYDANGNRTVMRLEPTGNGDGSLNLVASYVSANGDRLRVLWIENTRRQIFEMTTGTPRLWQVVVTGGDPAALTDFVFQSDDQWQKLLTGQTIDVTVGAKSCSIRLANPGESGAVELSVPVPLPVAMAVEIVSYTGYTGIGTDRPDMTIQDLMKMQWDGTVTEEEIKAFRAGQKITVDLGPGKTVTLRQASINPNTLTQDQRNALYGPLNLGGGRVDLRQRTLVWTDGYSGSLDSVVLSEAERNDLINNGMAVLVGTPVRPQQASEVLHLFDAVAQRLTQEQQERLALGDSVMLADGKVVSYVQVDQRVELVTAAYYGTPLGMSVRQDQSDSKLFHYTFLNPTNPTQDPVKIDLRADGFGDGWQKEYQGTLSLATTLQYGTAVQVSGWTGQGLPPSLKDVTLTAADWALLQSGGTVTRTVGDQVLTLEARPVTGLSEQQVKDLKAGRFVTVGSEVLASVAVESGEYFVTGSSGTELMKVIENADGTVQAFKPVLDANGDPTRDVNGNVVFSSTPVALSQEDAKAMQAAARKLAPPVAAGAKRTRSTGLTLKSEPLFSTEMLDISDMNGNNNRLENAQVAGNLWYTVSGNALPMFNGTRDFRDDIDQSFLLNAGYVPFSAKYGFVSRFEYDPNLPPAAVGIFGANAAGAAGLFGLLGAGSRAPPEIAGSLQTSSSTQVSPPSASVQAPVQNEQIAEQLDAQFRDRQNLTQRVLGRIGDLLRGMMQRLQGVSAGALGVLTESKIVEILAQLVAGFGAFLVNCGAIALAAMLQARHALLPTQVDLMVANLLVEQMRDQGLGPMLAAGIAGGVGPLLSARTIRLVAGLSNVNLQTIRVAGSSMELLLAMLSSAGSRAIIGLPGHFVTALGLEKDSAGNSVVRFLDSDNKEYRLGLPQFLNVWRAGGGYALVDKDAAPVTAAATTGPVFAPPTIAAIAPVQPPPAVSPAPEPEISSPVERIYTFPVIQVGPDEERGVVGAQPVPPLLPGQVDRVEADGTASHNESFVEFEFDDSGKLIGARGGSLSWGLTVFGEAFFTQTTDEYVITESLGQAKVSRSTAETTTHRADGSHVDTKTTTNFTYTNSGTDPAELPDYYRNPDGSVKDVFLDGAGQVREGLTLRVEGSVHGVGDTVFGETFMQDSIQRYDIIAGGPKVIRTETTTDTVAVDGGRSRSTQVVEQEYDKETGLLTAMFHPNDAPDVFTESEDVFGNKTLTRVLEQFERVNGQGKVVLAHTESITTGIDGATSLSISETRNFYSDGTEDPSALSPEYSQSAPNGMQPPSGRTWIGNLTAVTEEEVGYSDFEGLPQVYKGTVTLSTDAFGFSKTVSLVKNTYEIVSGQPKGVLSETHSTQRSNDGSDAVTVSLVRTGYTDGTEDPAGLAAEYHKDHPEGKVWKGLIKEVKEQEVVFDNPLTGASETYIGAVTVAHDAFQFTTSVSKASNRYDLVYGISRVGETLTTTENLSLDGANSATLSTTSYEYTVRESADLDGDGTVTASELEILLPGVAPESRAAYVDPSGKLYPTLLKAVSGFSATDGEDAFAFNKFHTDTTDTYSVIQGQARVATSHSVTTTTGDDDSTSTTTADVVNTYSSVAKLTGVTGGSVTDGEDAFKFNAFHTETTDTYDQALITTTGQARVATSHSVTTTTGDDDST
ncbi:MAG: hypothetical protein Q7J69_07175, partial [Candidatus Omnitrophota bacterium]|nr:hypothetical protein [Candidatus Omnitrophota bacterium]